MNKILVASLMTCFISTAELWEAMQLHGKIFWPIYRTSVVTNAHSPQGKDCAEFSIKGDHGLIDNNVTWSGQHMNVSVYACGATQMVVEYFLPSETKRKLGIMLRGEKMKGYDALFLGENE